MRKFLLVVAAFLASGCGLLGSLTRSNDSPQPLRLNEYTKINDAHRGVMHSNDPGKSKY